MAEPLTDLAYLESNGDSMRVKMELMIMKIQKEFCKALEKEEDPKNKFMVNPFWWSVGQYHIVEMKLVIVQYSCLTLNVCRCVS